MRLRIEAPLTDLRIQLGRAVAAVLESGEEVAGDASVSSADSARTFSWLDDAGSLPEEFSRGLRAIDYRSPVVKLNLALHAAPRFATRDRWTPPLSGRIHVGALELDALERAYDEARAERISSRPIVELTFASAVDQDSAQRKGDRRPCGKECESARRELENPPSLGYLTTAGLVSHLVRYVGRRGMVRLVA